MIVSNLIIATILVIAVNLLFFSRLQPATLSPPASTGGRAVFNFKIGWRIFLQRSGRKKCDNRSPYHFFGLLLVLFSCCATTTLAQNSNLLDFRWQDQPDRLTFNLKFDRLPQFVENYDLFEKHYFYLDCYGVAGPRDPVQWDLKSPLIFHVKRIFYPDSGVLRLVFYARPGVDVRVFTHPLDASTHTVTFTPVRYLNLDRAASLAQGSRKSIVVDAGHGGKPGQGRSPGGGRTSRKIESRHYNEKTITLGIAKRLQRLIDRAPNMDCVMTRGDDRYVSLGRRVEIAGQSQGDLFVSIHTNATSKRRKTARGFEIYYLSVDSKNTNRHLLALENEYGEDMDENLASHEELRKILRSLADEKFRQRQRESRQLSIAIDDAFRREGPFRPYHRGVKSGAFRVLMNFHMPAVLAECGFLDHPSEARLLVQPAVQNKIAALLFNGINRYFAVTDPQFVPYRISCYQ